MNESSNPVRSGLLLVFAAAVTWSLGGVLARYLGHLDPWTIVTWRAGFASLFLLGFLLWRDGWHGTGKLLAAMRGPSLLVALCFATASTAFVVALAHTSVANILLIQAAVPLIAALMTRLLFGEAIAAATWSAIALVMAGIAIMVSGSLEGKVSPIGDGLALLIALAFASATVTTRRHAAVRMVPAVWLGMTLACGFAAAMAPGYAVAKIDLAVLFAFGALSLGLGLALFVTGARRVPATIAALASVAEPVLGPLWVWLVHGEVPALRTLAGGGLVLAALLAHTLWQLTRRQAVA